MTSGTTKFLFLSIALTCATLTLPASAAPQSSDNKIIDQCVEAANGNAAFPGNCIGIVAGPCMKAADNETEASKKCAARELAIWNSRLQAAMNAIKTGGFPKLVASVQASQKGWASSLDQLCPIFDQIDPVAPLQAGVFCRLQETARRALILEHIGVSVSEH
jgi:hypothetical protein